METCDQSPKRFKRSFVDAWLTDKRYKRWIRKVSFDENLYYCTICEEQFSCTVTHVSRHGNSVGHRKNERMKGNRFNDDNVTDNDEENITPSKSLFKTKWLEINDHKLWLREFPHDKHMCFCTVCDQSFAACLAYIRRHAESKNHIKKIKARDEMYELNDDFTTQENETLLLFNERKKSAEAQFAALIVEKNIPFQTAQEILTFFQHIGQEDRNVLKTMTMGRTKCKNIISNVLCPVENEQIVNKLQKTKFFVFIDEATDSCNEKWMTFFVRYVDPETLDIRSQLVKLINIGKDESSGEKLFDAFECEMSKLKIPFSNIIALSCGNSSIMTKKHLTFKSKLEEICKNLLVFPCPCSSATSAVRAACSKIPSFCNDFLQKIALYIDISPARSAIFRVFCDCFQDKSKNVKFSKIHWLSHYSCIEKLLELWDKIKYFLQESGVNDKTNTVEDLLSMMDNLEMKAYFLFLKYILHSFNKFQAFFQSADTRIHLLQLKSVNFLTQLCENFIKRKYLKDVVITDIKLSSKKFHKDTNKIFVGTECEEYLNHLITEDYLDIVSTVRRTCLQFYLTVTKEIRKRLPISHDFLKKLQVFGPSKSLLGDDRETSFQHVFFIAKTLGLDDLDEKSLKEEWLTLSTDFTLEEKQSLSKINFDDMWKKILQHELSSNTYKYPNLRNVVNAIRSLPNSNVDSEKMFEILIDLKCQKRNKLSPLCVNATCVIKSALKTRGETAINMTITQEHLARMSSDKLYALCPEKESNSSENETADETADEMVVPSSSTE